jgi:hypothetical protein
VAAPIVKRAPRQQREIRLVNEFISTYFPDDPVQTQVRLGPIVPRNAGQFISEAEMRLAGEFRRRADAVVYRPMETVVIEGAIRPTPGDVSLIEFYAHLLPDTPEMVNRSQLPIRKLLVFALRDSVLIAFALRRGIDVQLFKPSWVDEYLLEVPKRHAQES